VAEVYPELVASDPQTGEPQAVLYHVLPALLLNELQRQQRQLETQATRIEARAAELAALRARLTILEARHPATSTAHSLDGAQAGVPGPR
jgi:type II secretory pathway component PulJ